MYGFCLAAMKTWKHTYVQNIYRLEVVSYVARSMKLPCCVVGLIFAEFQIAISEPLIHYRAT